MGIFGSRKKTVLSSTTASMVTDSPDIVQQSVLTSIALGTNIADDLVANLQAGLASSMQRYLSTGRHRRETYGVDLFPISHNTQFSTRVLDIEYALNQIHGESVSVVTYTYQPLDTDMMAYEYMAATYGYDITDHSFTTSPSGYPVDEVTFVSSYLVDGVLHIQYGNTQNEDIHTETTTVTGLDTSEVYYHVLYALVSDLDTYLFWNYQVSTNAFPFLTQNEFATHDGYFPVVPIIEYSRNMTDSSLEDTPQYEASRALLNTLGLNFVDVHESLLESESYDSIEQAHFSCSVRLRDDDPYALKYMFTFFKALYTQQSYSKENIDEWKSLNNTHIHPPVTSLNYRMAAFKTDLKWSYMTSKIVTKPWAHGDLEYKRFHAVKAPVEITYTDDAGETIKTGQYYDESTVTFIRKIDDNTQEEITAVGISQINYINDQYSIEWDVAAMFDDSAEGQDPVTFLVQPDLVQNAFPSLLEKNTFYYRTYTLVLNFKTVVKLKWYQTSFFQFVMIVVAIVITVWSVGTLAESLALAYSAAGGGLAGITAALGQAFIFAGISLATNWVMGELLERYGWGSVAMVAAMLVAMVSLSPNAVGFLPDGYSVAQFTTDLLQSFENFFQESSQDLMAQANADLEAYREWEKEYDTMYDELFDLGDSFAEIYAEFTKNKSIYNSMTADEYMFVAMDMLLMAPAIVTGATETYFNNALSVDV